MALALYRKYRPATFADVVGQEHVTEPLRTALAAGRVNHAYLFSGPRGCGKTSSARILARSLNCELGPTADPCGVCPSCVALAPEGPGNIDVIELDAASHGGVDDARELRDRAFYAPAESRFRVFIVDEAHMVTTQGFNALLKIVEEPPEHLVFVFATTEPDKVLSTIRSRTHHYPFRLIPPGTLRALLERICADEGAVVAPAVFPLVIRAGGGSARDTLSIMDQLLAGAGPDGVAYERAVALLGVTDVALIDDAVDALAAGDGAAVFETVDRLVEAGHDPRRFATDLLERLRDLTLLQAVPDAAARGLVDSPADELDRMTDQAARLGAATLSRYADIVHTGLTEMRGATAPRLLLELLCGRMLLPAASTGELALLQRLERIERRADIVVDPRPDGLPASDGGATPSGSGTGSAAPDPSGARTFRRRSRQPGDPDAAGSADAAAEPALAPPADGPAVDPAAPGATGPGTVPARPAGPVPAPESGGGVAGDPPTHRPVGDAPPAAAGPDTARDAPVGPAPSPDASARETTARETGAEESAATVQTATDRPAATVPGVEGPDAAERPDAAGVSPAAGRAGEPRGGIDAAAVRRAWPAVLEAAKKNSRSTGALLVNATVRVVEDDTLVLSIAAAPLARRLSEQRNTEVISNALREVLGVAWRVRCEHDPGGSAPARAGGPAGGAPPVRPTPPPAPPSRSREVPARPSAAEPPPPPPEPPDEPDYDDEELDTSPTGPRATHRDPEEAAIELLSSKLGARAFDDRR